jgi:hypothetical protein
MVDTEVILLSLRTICNNEMRVIRKWAKRAEMLGFRGERERGKCA